MAIPFLNNLNLNNNEVQNVKLHNTGSAPNNAAGQVYFNTSDNLAKYYSNGTDLWVSLKEYSFTNGTYVDVTTTGTTVKPIFELDLSAVDGTAGSGERYLTKGNKWALVSEIVGTTYDLSGFGTTNGTAGIQLVGSDATTDQIDITGSGTTTVTHSSNTITITSNDQYTGTVESVGLSMPSAFTVSNSPITSSGDIGVTGAGTSAQYIDGTGALQTFPAIDNTTYSLDLSAVSSNSTILTLDASSGDDDTVKFEGTTNEIEITTPATGDAGTVKIGLPDNVTITNDLTVGGDINVTGSLNSYTTSELLVQDQYITLNSGQTSGVLDAFVKVERGATDVALKWNESTDRWQFTNDGSTYYNIPISSEYDNFNFNVRVGVTSQEVGNGGTVTFAAGNSGLTVAIGGDDTITYSHADTSSATSVNNLGLTVIQDLTIDDYGHVTAIGSQDITAAVVSEITNRQIALLVGDGSATSIDLVNSGATSPDVNHGLGTDSSQFMIQLIDANTGETVYADVTRGASGLVTLDFATAPSANGIRVLIIFVAGNI
jgi:hypothetical protein